MTRRIQPGQPSIELLLSQIALFLQSQLEQREVELDLSESVAPGNETLDVKEAALHLRVSEWTIYDMVRTKTISHFRIRKRIFFRRRELDQWINNQLQEVR